LIEGGEFPMGRSEDGTDQYSGELDELPEHPATVSSFRLDVLEVTVGRFRRFVAQYPDSAPKVGDGAHPRLPGSGWAVAWTNYLPADADELRAALSCDATLQTWTEEPGALEDRPMNCVTWYEAIAFCAWDGGRLPTEAEWEYAAAGGAENRLFPWGQEDVGSRAISGCSSCSVSDLPGVGSTPSGAGRFGQLDLAGSLAEWVLDRYDSGWYPGGGAVCDDCANLDGSASVAHGVRGGSIQSSDSRVRAAERFQAMPAQRRGWVGFRCAREK